MMKRRATALLGVAAVAFVVLVVFADDGGAWGYAVAAAEGALVGGLADWFAVTALFRHPLGIPIPHTAVIRERKDQFGATLGSFVQENFLSPDVVVERVRNAHVGERLAAWLADPANAESVARHAGDLVVGLADTIKDEDVHRVVEDEVRRGVDALPVAELAGRGLRMMTAQGRHQELFDSVLVGLERFLGEQHDALRLRFGEQLPRWLPQVAQDRIFERLLDGVSAFLTEVNADPGHELRREVDAWAADFAERLEHDPALATRIEEVKRELLEHPELREWTGSLWGEAKASLRSQAEDPESELRRRLAEGVQKLGQRLCDDDALRARLDDMLESAISQLTTQFHDEIGSLVSGTIARWDAEETSDKLELLLGRDLQWIRVNGTVVGALAGVAIHAIGTVAG